jgi:hypothetical protein
MNKKKDVKLKRNNEKRMRFNDEEWEEDFMEKDIEMTMKKRKKDRK